MRDCRPVVRERERERSGTYNLKERVSTESIDKQESNAVRIDGIRRKKRKTKKRRFLVD